MILTGGGKESLHVMKEFFYQTDNKSVKQKPMVIIMNGSGGLADLLSTILKDYET